MTTVVYIQVKREVVDSRPRREAPKLRLPRPDHQTSRSSRSTPPPKSRLPRFTGRTKQQRQQHSPSSMQCPRSAAMPGGSSSRPKNVSVSPAPRSRSSSKPPPYPKHTSQHRPERPSDVASRMTNASATPSAALPARHYLQSLQPHTHHCMRPHPAPPLSPPRRALSPLPRLHQLRDMHDDLTLDAELDLDLDEELRVMPFLRTPGNHLRTRLLSPQYNLSPTSSPSALRHLSPPQQPHLFGHHRNLSPPKQPHLFSHRNLSPPKQPHLFSAGRFSPPKHHHSFGHRAVSPTKQPHIVSHRSLPQHLGSPVGRAHAMIPPPFPLPCVSPQRSPSPQRTVSRRNSWSSHGHTSPRHSIASQYTGSSLTGTLSPSSSGPMPAAAAPARMPAHATRSVDPGPRLSHQQLMAQQSSRTAAPPILRSSAPTSLTVRSHTLHTLDSEGSGELSAEPGIRAPLSCQGTLRRGVSMLEQEASRSAELVPDAEVARAISTGAPPAGYTPVAESSARRQCAVPRADAEDGQPAGTPQLNRSDSEASFDDSDDESMGMLTLTPALAAECSELVRSLAAQQSMC